MDVEWPWNVQGPGPKAKRFDDQLKSTYSPLDKCKGGAFSNFLTTQYCMKKRKHSFHILKVLFSSDTRQSMKRRITTESRAEIYTRCR